MRCAPPKANRPSKRMKTSIAREAPQVYGNRSCVPQNFSSGFGHATAGKCTSACQRKPLLLDFPFLVIFFTFLSSIPALTETLRGHPQAHRLWLVIDKACPLWQNQCGHQGSCFVYQNVAMSWYMLIAGLVYKVLGFLFFAIACFQYKPPSGSSDGSEDSLPSQSSVSNNPMELQLQSDN